MAAASLKLSRQKGLTDAEFETYFAPTNDAGSSMETQLLSYILEAEQVYQGCAVLCTSLYMFDLHVTNLCMLVDF